MRETRPDPDVSAKMRETRPDPDDSLDDSKPGSTPPYLDPHCKCIQSEVVPY